MNKKRRRGLIPRGVRLSIDRQRRIVLPQSVRRALQKEGKRYVVVSPGRNGTIQLWLPSEFDGLIRRIGREPASPDGPGRKRQLLRAICSAALQRMPESGRIRLHPFFWNFSKQPKRITLRIAGGTQP